MEICYDVQTPCAFGAASGHCRRRHVQQEDELLRAGRGLLQSVASVLLCRYFAVRSRYGELDSHDNEACTGGCQNRGVLRVLPGLLLVGMLCGRVLRVLPGLLLGWLLPSGLLYWGEGYRASQEHQGGWQEGRSELL